MDNKTIEMTLLEIARILDLRGENPFKVRAYENAARAVASLEEDVPTLIKEERLKHIPGIGSSIREKLLELCGSGKLEYLEEIRAGIPPGVFDMMKIQGLGPKKTKILWEQLGITSLEDLERACKEDRVSSLKGFGKKTQDKILSGLVLFSRTRDRVLRAEALPEAMRLADALRRGRETVRDVDILVGAPQADPVMETFVAHPDVVDVIGRGPTKTSVHVKSGLQVDVRVVPPASFACALAYFTGSKEFNVHLRQIALDLGYTLNEYSLRPLDGSPAPPLATEADLFAKLGLAYVEPELRENTGEIDAARAGKLPALVAPHDLQGVLHVHTTWSDGVGSVEDMVAEAEQLGYRFVGISDHSQAAHYANGLSPERLRAQRVEVEAARAAHPSVTVLHGIECDIMGDGSLDLPDDCLAELDFVIASVHTELSMERERMTARLVRAVSHPLVRVLGHPTNRRLLEREPSAFDWEPVLEAARKNDVAIEVNGQPQRLDADWVHIRRVRAKGVKLCINPDAHAPGTLDDARRHALVEARRGWATRDDVVNALPPDRFVSEFLKRVRPVDATPLRPEAVTAPIAPATPAPAPPAKKPRAKKKAGT
jgi:DNA polymerase (family X)